ncbi:MULTISPECIES: WhiB family transcriptional regulator [Actinomycetes]|uniref:WhiB family transcriptional regulator n=1 Tax=Micromonospora sp. NPDC005367 TaxID=3155590 RepID=UPI0033A0CF13
MIARQIRDRWAKATCRRPEHEAWAREHHGSRWDATIDGERARARHARIAYAQQLCGTCPLREQCRQHHAELERVEGRRIAGVWAGRSIIDRDTKPRLVAA